MPIYSAYATLSGKASAEALGEALEQLGPEGVGVFEIEDGSGRFEVAAYFETPPDGVVLALLAAVHGAADFVVSEVPETDWVAHVRRELAPVEAGRFFVYGSHDADRVPEGREALLIEAAMAFGTGHHGTTKGCLLALDLLLSEGWKADHVADIGCGTAVLAMAAARVWPGAEVLASDIDPVAVDVALANVQANALSGRVECLVAEGLGHPRLAAAAPFDLIFANILKGPLLALAPGLCESLRAGGYAILSGILNEQAAEIIERYARLGMNVSHRQEIGDWTTLTLEKVAVC